MDLHITDSDPVAGFRPKHQILHQNVTEYCSSAAAAS